jgi:hypothetical protein
MVYLHRTDEHWNYIIKPEIDCDKKRVYFRLDFYTNAGAAIQYKASNGLDWTHTCTL